MGCGCGWGGVDERVEVGGGVDDGWRSVVGGSLGERSVVTFLLISFYLFEMLTIVGFYGLKAHANHLNVNFGPRSTEFAQKFNF